VAVLRSPVSEFSKRTSGVPYIVDRRHRDFKTALDQLHHNEAAWTIGLHMIEAIRPGSLHIRPSVSIYTMRTTTTFLVVDRRRIYILATIPVVWAVCSAAM
jgi:hypothetical protein